MSEADPDAEGEVEVAEQGDGEADDTLYCICQQKSYGEMIGCDNDKCEYEWVSWRIYAIELSIAFLMSRKLTHLVAVPRQMRRYYPAFTGNMVLPGLCTEAWTVFERWKVRTER